MWKPLILLRGWADAFNDLTLTDQGGNTILEMKGFHSSSIISVGMLVPLSQKALHPFQSKPAPPTP